MIDEFLSIDGPAEATIKVRGSSFIAYAHPVETKERADTVLAGRRKQFHDATHHCYAYRIGIGTEEDIRMADAGEPSGTAGKPILMAITGRDLTNIIVVVTRYFGGTKLGTGGLARAYGDAAAAVLDQCRVRTILLTDRLKFSFSYDDTNTVMRLVQKYNAHIVQSDYDSLSHLTIDLRQSQLEAFRAELTDLTRGSATFE